MSLRNRIPALVLPVVLLATVACGGDSNPAGPSTPAAVYSSTDLVVGTGATALLGSRVTVHYSLWLYDPAQPESKGRLVQTTAGGAPAVLVIASGQVIAGWVQGVPNMRVGGKRRLILPPSLAYGSQGSPPDIPGNASLVFDIELVSVG